MHCPGTGAVGLPRRLPALEARNLAWLVWAHEIVGLPTSGVRWEAAAQTAAAEGLAACMPYIVCLDAVAVEVRPYRLALQLRESTVLYPALGHALLRLDGRWLPFGRIQDKSRMGLMVCRCWMRACSRSIWGRC